MLCRKSLVNSSRGSFPVHLNVYDLTPVNCYAYWLGLGVYHSGLEVHGVEYAYGAHEYETTGIFEGVPKQCEGFTFRKSVLIGYTDTPSGDVLILMKQLSEKYRGNAYNLISKNCNHFCNDASLKLTGNSIPNWVNRLARIGFLCQCIIPTNLNRTKVRHHKMEDNKDCETTETDKKKKIKSCSCRITANPLSSDVDTEPSSSLCSIPRAVGNESKSKSTMSPPQPLV